MLIGETQEVKKISAITINDKINFMLDSAEENEVREKVSLFISWFELKIFAMIL